jgi:hypothetical protein
MDANTLVKNYQRKCKGLLGVDANGEPSASTPKVDTDSPSLASTVMHLSKIINVNVKDY